MTSIFERALGNDFGRLHPELRKRFGFSAADGIACVGTGTMDEIWHGRAFTLPFLYLGAARNILFPERGTSIPFTIKNFAYHDGYGRETVTFVRTFDLPGGVRRRFDATMIYSTVRGGVVDYLGTCQHLAVDLDLSADSRGGLLIRTGGQRFYEGLLGFRMPQILSGDAEVREWYDDDVERFRISVTVTNRRMGNLFGYRGSFTAAYLPVGPAGVPADVRPSRESARE